MQIDLHTHQIALNPDFVSVFNLILRENEGVELPDTWFSAGIHPWYLPKELNRAIAQLENVIRSPFCIAVGECGLDRAIESPLKRQEEVFYAQADLAARFNKPLILHCVKANSEMIRLRKSFSTAPPWILHAFHGNEKVLDALLQYDFYFSVNPAAGRSSVHPDMLRKIPLSHLFLETDDSGISIDVCYEKAAEILSIPIDNLVKQIHLNFKKIFR